jgi:hypothetical protein
MLKFAFNATCVLHHHAACLPACLPACLLACLPAAAQLHGGVQGSGQAGVAQQAPGCTPAGQDKAGDSSSKPSRCVVPQCVQLRIYAGHGATSYHNLLPDTAACMLCPVASLHCDLCSSWQRSVVVHIAYNRIHCSTCHNLVVITAIAIAITATDMAMHHSACTVLVR